MATSLALLLVLSSGWAEIPPAPVTLVVQDGISETNVHLVRRTLAAFDGILLKEMDTRLDHPVRLILCRGSNAYRQTLESEFRMKPEQAEKSARLTGGMSKNISNTGLIAIRFEGDAVALGKGTSTMAHELFHQIQGQWAGRYKGRGAYFLSEGTADYMAAFISAQLGMQSLDRWKLERRNSLRRASNWASPAEIVRTDLSRWTTLLENGMHPYEMADLMVFDIMTRATNRGLRAIRTYYQTLGSGSNEMHAFQTAFGMDGAAFLTAFSESLRTWKHAQVGIQVIPFHGAPIGAHDTVTSEIRQVQKMFLEDWGWPLTQERRFLLVPDGTEAIRARIQDLGQDPGTVDRKSASNTRWLWNGNTAILRMEAPYGDVARQRDVAQIFIGMLLNESASRSSLDQVAWLHAGLQELAIGRFLERMETQDFDKSTEQWRLACRSRVKTLSLTGLRSSSGYQTNLIRFGTKAVTGYAALAVRELEAEHGPEIFKSWAEQIKTRRDVATLFQEVFETGLLDFEKQFSEEIKAH